MNSRKINIFIAILLFTITSCSTDKKLEVVDLQCEYLENPMGIDVITPRLIWRLETDKNNVKQTSYQILVASNITKLNNNIGDLWDTDTIFSDQTTHIVYSGSELKSRQKVFWKVRTWDQNNIVSEWSEISSWEMALLEQSDWKAKWIGKNQIKKAKVGERNPAIYFRKIFNVQEDIENARVYISGLGYYELYINGKKVGDHVLAPNQTNYDKRQVDSYENDKIANMSKRVLYETFDIRSYLQKGENVVSVILGNGWYYQTERTEYMPLYFDTPRLVSQIEINYSDSSKQIIVSDESWRNSVGPILDNNIYIGEIYDARLENVGWNEKEFDDSKWENSSLVRTPDGKLQAQMSPPDKVLKTINPNSISSPNKNIFRYDFGTMFSGWIKLKVAGERGTELKMTFYEDSDNSYGQTDTYILKGEGIEVWEPRFTWHAFRFVEISGSPNPLTLDNVEGRVVNTNVEIAGTFESSNSLFNTILADFNETQLGNMHGGVPTDCPHRERRGYTGDGQIAAQAAIYNLDMKSFYTKWINDIADGQNRKTGYVPNTTPYHSGGGGTAWGSAYIIIPWYMYLYYGDDSILKEHYAGMKKYIKYLDGRTDEDNLIYIDPKVEWDLGEWVPPVVTVIPRSFVSSAYYFYDLTLMAEIANILGEKSEATLFNTSAEEVKKSFNKRYYDKGNHSYSIGYQGANVFPLAFGLVPEENEIGVFESLVKNVQIKNKGHFDTGMMGTPYLLEVLTNYGRADLAYTVMNRRDFPSFGYNIERGATTLWETWTGNESHSHPMFGSVTAWFYQGLGGINPDVKNPGFKHIIIKPNIIKGLDFVNSTYPSMYGDIISNWKYNSGNFELNVTVPPNTTASVFIPGNNVDEIIIDNKNIEFIEQEDNLFQYEVPSGQYTFISKSIDNLVKSPMLSGALITPADSILFSHDSVTVSIRQYSKDAEIRYTLDGTEPNENSSSYSNPFKLNKSTVIKARVFKSGIKPGFTKTSRVVFIDSDLNGLNYEYYLGAWTMLPNFSKLQPTRKGKVYDFNLTQINSLDEKFGIVFSGQIEIIESSDYTFYLNSNDGSKLFINNQLIVDADGLHGFSGSSCQIYLEKGRHNIRVDYFQAGGGKGLELLYESPNIEKQKIPADAMFLAL